MSFWNGVHDAAAEMSYSEEIPSIGMLVKSLFEVGQDSRVTYESSSGYLNSCFKVSLIVLAARSTGLSASAAGFVVVCANVCDEDAAGAICDELRAAKLDPGRPRPGLADCPF